MPRSVPRLPRQEVPGGGSAPGLSRVGSRKSGVGSFSLRRPTSPAATILRLRGHARGSAALVIPRKRVPTSRSAVYPRCRARGVRQVARRDAVARECLPCDTRARCHRGGIGSTLPRTREMNGGEIWPVTEPASRRQGRSRWCGSSTAPREGISLEPPVWRRICCTITTNNYGR